jgi:hypothetical protein
MILTKLPSLLPLVDKVDLIESTPTLRLLRKIRYISAPGRSVSDGEVARLFC